MLETGRRFQVFNIEDQLTREGLTAEIDASHDGDRRRKTNRWHLQITNRWVVQYNFYINDGQWGRMFVRICPYLPFSARVRLNQHHWLANRMREEGIHFRQCANAFMTCAKPERLQQLADSLTARDLVSCGQKWLARLTPFFTSSERQEAGCRHRPSSRRLSTMTTSSSGVARPSTIGRPAPECPHHRARRDLIALAGMLGSA